MNKKRIFYSKDSGKKYFICGEFICRKDCEVCKQLYHLNVHKGVN